MTNALLMGKKGALFQTSKGKKVEIDLPLMSKSVDADVGPMIIHGKEAMSTYEWYVSLALDQLGLKYSYQKAIGGGRSRRGGQMLDFVVWSAQTWVLDVRGAYWHTGANDDELSFQRAVREYMSGAKVLVLWDEHCVSKESVLTFLRQNGLG